MGKVSKWIKAVIANQTPYAPLAGVDIQKSAEKLFQEERPKGEEKEGECHGD